MTYACEYCCTTAEAAPPGRAAAPARHAPIGAEYRDLRRFHVAVGVGLVGLKREVGIFDKYGDAAAVAVAVATRLALDNTLG